MLVAPWGGAPPAGRSVPQGHATPACTAGLCIHSWALSLVHEQTKAWS